MLHCIIHNGSGEHRTVPIRGGAEGVFKIGITFDLLSFASLPTKTGTDHAKKNIPFYLPDYFAEKYDRSHSPR